MSSLDFTKIPQQKLDILTEAGNIGAGNAVTALSQLLNKRVDMSVAKVRIKSINELSNVLGDEESYIAAMLIEVLGDIKGMLILALETESAKQMVATILGTAVISLEEFGEMEFSVLCETGNILAGSYLSALSNITGLELAPSTPEMAIDMAAAILSFPAIEFTKDGNNMLFVETRFSEDANTLNGMYILVLEDLGLEEIVGSLEKLL
jgi:chemotaxis protein CheC